MCVSEKERGEFILLSLLFALLRSEQKRISQIIHGEIPSTSKAPRELCRIELACSLLVTNNPELIPYSFQLNANNPRRPTKDNHPPTLCVYMLDRFFFFF